MTNCWTFYSDIVSTTLLLKSMATWKRIKLSEYGFLPIGPVVRSRTMIKVKRTFVSKYITSSKTKKGFLSHKSRISRYKLVEVSLPWDCCSLSHLCRKKFLFCFGSVTENLRRTAWNSLRREFRMLWNPETWTYFFWLSEESFSRTSSKSKRTSSNCSVVIQRVFMRWSTISNFLIIASSWSITLF